MESYRPLSEEHIPEGLFAPDILASYELEDAQRSRPRLVGERRLMLAMLKDAVECLQKYRRVRSRSGQELYRTALEWVEDKSDYYLFTFSNVCTVLGYDPDCLRGVLLRDHRDIKKVQIHRW